jgi:hypothetical protein
VRPGHRVAAGHVDGAEQRAGVRIVHRRGRAAPRLHRPAVVLAAVDLDGVVEGQRGARGVGARDVLGPAGPLDEVHALRARAQPGVTLHPQHPAGRVGDRDDHLVGLGVLHQQPADHRHDRRQRVGRPVGEQVVVEQVHRRRPTVGVDAVHQAAPPGFPHDRAHHVVGRFTGSGHDPFVGGTEPPGQGGSRLAPGEGQPRGGRGQGAPAEWLMSGTS